MSDFNFLITANNREVAAYLTPPEGERKPGIVLLAEIFGVNAAMRLAASEFSAQGYTVLVPDLFNQVAPRIELGYTDVDRAKAVALWKRMDDQVALEDAYAAVDALRRDPSCNGKVAVVGFCLGGKYSLQMAAKGRIDAAIAYYPVRVQDYAESLLALKCPTQAHVGDQDAHIPGEVLAILRDVLREPGRAEVHVYPGAGHGFYNAVRKIGYSPEAADASRESAVKFMQKALR